MDAPESTHPEPLASPVRVLCKGASTVNWISYMGGPRSDMAYPRALEVELLRRGRAAEVRDTSRAAEMPKDALAAWEREVVTWSPDVVVLYYGMFECIHLVLPRALQRYAQSLQRRPGPLADLYWRRVVRPVWQALAKVQQRVAPHVPGVVHDWRLRRTLRDLRRLVDRISLVGSPLVLLMEVSPPGQSYESWFPGMTARTARMNRALEALVAEVGRPEVRMFPTERHLTTMRERGESVCSDGIHYTPAAHRAVAAGLADEVEVFAESHHHLASPRRRAAS